MHTLNYELGRPSPKGKNKKVIGLINDESSGKIMKEFAALRAKTYSYLTDNNDQYKKATNKCVIKKLKFEDYKNFLRSNLFDRNIHIWNMQKFSM